MGRYTSPSPRVRDASRSFCSSRKRTRRTRTVSLTLLTNSSKRSSPTRSRLRRQKRLLPSILPSTEKLNKILRRLRRGPRSARPTSLNTRVHVVSPCLLDQCKESVDKMRSKINLVFLKTNGLNHGFEIPFIFIHLLTKSNTFI